MKLHLLAFALAMLAAGCGETAIPRIDSPCLFELHGACVVADPGAPPVSQVLAVDFEEVLSRSAATWNTGVNMIGWQIQITSAAVIYCGNDKPNSLGCTDFNSKVIQIYDDGRCVYGVLPHEFGHAIAGFHDHSSPHFQEVEYPGRYLMDYNLLCWPRVVLP
jgi:hypothetical protein